MTKYGKKSVILKCNWIRWGWLRLLAFATAELVVLLLLSEN